MLPASCPFYEHYGTLLHSVAFDSKRREKSDVKMRKMMKLLPNFD